MPGNGAGGLPAGRHRRGIIIEEESDAPSESEDGSTASFSSDDRLSEAGETASALSSSSPLESDEPLDVVIPAVKMTARAYQLEMLEESLKQNVIVAMDTGSGKTQVAILRIQKELENSDKIAWFLAPTVALAEQQYEAIRAQIPGVQSKLIRGCDNVDAWSTKPGVWDAVLFNTRIVVSTYQILSDAVAHAFVPLASIGLIVIDEAHNPVRKNPVARLMREHYAPNKARGLPVPHILGLTASPLMTSNLDDLEVLENTLNAICKTPSKHRDELLAQVNRPEMRTVSYGDGTDADAPVPDTPTMTKLKRAYQSLDLREDPYILHLKASKSQRDRDKLKKAIMTKKTYSRLQMESFCNRAKEMCKVFGPWAADYYIHRVIVSFLQDPIAPSQPNDSLAEQERKYLAAAFAQVEAEPPSGPPTDLSARVDALIGTLEAHPGNPIGIVFVKERAAVAVLSHILAVHPRTAGRYRVGSMVGTSKVPNKRDDFLDLSQKDYLLSLQAFRKGTINLVVATSVLEEGIDVPACNLVICFDELSNLKSFIQRRGRARMAASQLYLLVQNESDAATRDWQNLEREMKKKYEDDMRENQRLEAIEDNRGGGDGESGSVEDYPVLRNDETGAQITLLDARQHLEHFCAILSTRKFVDWSPFFIVHDLDGNPVDAHTPGLRKATVHLPVSLAPELRTFRSLFAWSSEANAIKDAAFQAYKGMYEVGLVGKHMLPIRETDLLKEVEPRAGLAAVREQMNPWPAVAQGWKRDNTLISRAKVTISKNDGTASADMEISLPVPIPDMDPFDIFWGDPVGWRVSMQRGSGISSSSGTDMVREDSQPDHSSALLASAFGHRWKIDDTKTYPVRFTSPDRDLRAISDDPPLTPEAIATMGQSTHLVRDKLNQKHPYFYLSWLNTKPSPDLVQKGSRDLEGAPSDVPYAVVKAWPRPTGSFRPPTANTIALEAQAAADSAADPTTGVARPYPRVLPAENLYVDSTPAVYAYVGMMAPAITHALEWYFVAKDLLESRLEGTGIGDVGMVVTAISTSGTRGPRDYERVEFLGDSILKLCTTVNCSANYLMYPEGFLSPLKDKIVSNARLFRAAVDFGLDRYILHKAFTLHRWRPTYIEDLLASPPSATGVRQMSTKTLADVVEALIGTAFLSGGMSNALACTSLFLPDIEWNSLEHGREVLYNEAPHDEELPVTMRRVEELIGYTFTKKSLLVEAMTHPSCNGPGIRASLDRLEFLGDAILDYVIVNKLFSLSDPKPLENSELHLFRTALVNADILGFMVLEWCLPADGPPSSTATTTNNGQKTPDVNTNFLPAHLHPTTTPIPLWTFLRHASPDLGAMQQATILRHASLRGPILHALHHGPNYPWALFAHLQLNKFYSDIFESVLGAVWVDSGSLEACEQVVEKSGLGGLLRRLVAGGVWCLHPKEELGILAARLASNAAGEREEEGVVGETERLFKCEVVVGGEVVGRATGAVTKEEARTRAAEKACAVLKGRASKS
ncbi:uncharacterized protein C8A04DRAFT_9801 [Dichotomopilus funicola]|uniref:Dicer-like protein 2 n=1 Tax=Dichotomopilus funicola TaxID=1934379 RepID=A0AAN6V8L4_9PEZI|nr:hypothetical protein C8A04DRAFT_9801 [Dichotomopilus funicola]